MASVMTEGHADIKDLGIADKVFEFLKDRSDFGVILFKDGEARQRDKDEMIGANGDIDACEITKVWIEAKRFLVTASSASYDFRSKGDDAFID